MVRPTQASCNSFELGKETRARSSFPPLLFPSKQNAETDFYELAEVDMLELPSREHGT